MASDLTAYFLEGQAARAGAGRCLENGVPQCPYYASSPAGDAWLSGWSFECDRMAGNTALTSPVRRAWHGRGYSVNVQMARGRVAYVVEFPADSPAFARLQVA